MRQRRNSWRSQFLREAQFIALIRHAFVVTPSPEGEGRMHKIAPTYVVSCKHEYFMYVILYMVRAICLCNEAEATKDIPEKTCRTSDRLYSPSHCSKTFGETLSALQR